MLAILERLNPTHSFGRVIWLITILLLAFYLRLYGLGDIAIDSDESYDYTHWISDSFRTIMIDDLVLNNQTFSHILARGAILLFGNSLFALRWPSLCISVLGVVFCYKMALRLFGVSTGLGSALLLALSPYAIFFAHNFRGYMGVIVFPLLVYWLALLALQTDQWRYWVALGGVTAMMMYTHLFTVLAWLNLLLFFCLVWGWRVGGLKRPSLRRLGSSLAITGLLMMVFYAPVWSKIGLDLLNSGQIKLTDFVWVQRPEVSASIWYNLWLYNGYWQKGSLGGHGAYILLGLVLLGLVISFKQDKRFHGLIIFAWAFLPFFEIWLAKQFLINFWVRPNYLGYTLVPFLILAAWAMSELPHYNFLKKLPSIGVRLFLFILLVVFWILPIQEFYQVFAGADWQAIDNFLHQHSTGDDLVVCQQYQQPWRDVNIGVEDSCTRTLNYRNKAVMSVSTGYDLAFNILPKMNTGAINRLGRVWLVVWGVPETAQLPSDGSIKWVEFNQFGRAWIIQADRSQSTYVANLAEAIAAVSASALASEQQFSYNLLLASLFAANGDTGRVKTALDLAHSHQPTHPESAIKLATVEQLVATYGNLLIKNPLAVNFEDKIMLQGYELNPPKVTPGDTFELTLFWKALTPIKENYLVFLHLRNSTGQTVAQFDFQPFDGSYPTQKWQPGQSLSETRRWQIPVNFLPGQYHFVLGFYRADTLARLSVVDDRSGENAFSLTFVQVD